MGSGLLVDGDRRGEAFDIIHVRLVHLPQELARISRQRLDVASLSFSEDGIEGQRRFSRAGKAGDDHQFIPGNFDRDVFKVVLAGSNHADHAL